MLDWDSPYLKKLHEMTDALLEPWASGKFIVGMTDWHPAATAWPRSVTRSAWPWT